MFESDKSHAQPTFKETLHSAETLLKLNAEAIFDYRVQAPINGLIDLANRETNSHLPKMELVPDFKFKWNPNIDGHVEYSLP